jgi:signal transduction histidine kinase/ActR/RegA family two-component response regulator
MDPSRHLGAFAAWRARLGWRAGRAEAVAEARRQEAIAGLAQRALEGAESKDLLVEASTLVARVLDVPQTAVLAWDTERPRLDVVAGSGWRVGVVGRLGIDLARRPAAVTALQGLEPVVLGAADSAVPLAEVAFLGTHDVKTGLALAIVARGRPYGSILVATHDARRFADPEIAFVRGVARILAVALGREYGERALFEEMQMSTVLAHVGRELMACSGVDAVLASACELGAQALRCDHAVTWLRRADDHGFRPVASHGLPGSVRDALATIVLADDAVAPLLGELAEREAVALVAPGGRHAVIDDLMQRLGIRAAVLTALVERESVAGFQMTGHRDRGAEIRGNDERIAAGIAQLASTALMNARVVEELSRASALKSEFVSTMSHELRTPLNIIIGYTDMLRDAVGPEEQAPLLAQVRKASHELLELIDGTLNLNRLTAGGDVARFAPVALADLWRDLQDDFAALPASPEVVVRWPDPKDLAFETDRRKLKIIIKNLVGNALKFTAKGEIVVGAERVGDQCRLTVRDTGIGISRDALPHVFDMFRQADSSETRSFGGAGLGLYIVRSLATQLGGEVQVESGLGQGSIFTIVLPLEQRAVAEARASSSTDASPASAETSTEAKPDECAIHARRALLFADDLPLNRLLVRRFVASEFPFVDVLEACDGEQAVAAFEQRHPDLVLLDLHMPQLDGWQAASAIRRRPGGTDVPIVALSVDASPNAEATAMRAGFQEFIAKPISDYSALKARLTYWLGPRDAKGKAIAVAPNPDCEHCRAVARRAAAA